ncbi:uncharacterized protein LOC132615628 [Lycium barbarum]|uniref:uncharacterized protein LOC132615628 n=1 Tax=Lycium barbarum TaxID=112863 RepID=UPI00293F2867|nr:uncharacterized protein LOC132615628 [Lycium barbarum]
MGGSYGFSDKWVNLVWRSFSNIWYSILINGSRKGFFHSSRGLRQGDPLSPALFILGAEVLFRMLNTLHNDNLYTSFSMNRFGPQISHLAYADDVIIFTSGDLYSLNLVKIILNNYAKCSGQLINEEKSCFMVNPNTCSDEVARIKEITGYKYKEFPFTYLGCPIYVGRKLISTFNAAITKVVRKTSGWQGKLLSIGGCTDEKKKLHWSSWAKMCYPTEEGGLGFRRLKDISDALEMKRWWRFRTEKSLWAEFIKVKYCRLSHHVDRK